MNTEGGEDRPVS